MKRGTTPTLKLKVTGIDVSILTSIYITLEQGIKELTKSGDDVVVDPEENALYIYLTQEETLDFKDGDAKIQLRAITDNDTAIASNIKTVPIGHILKEGVIS